MWLWASGRLPYYADFWSRPYTSIGGLLAVTYWREVCMCACGVCVSNHIAVFIWTLAPLCACVCVGALGYVCACGCVCVLRLFAIVITRQEKNKINNLTSSRYVIITYICVFFSFSDVSFGACLSMCSFTSTGCIAPCTLGGIPRTDCCRATLELSSTGKCACLKESRKKKEKKGEKIGRKKRISIC